MTSGCPADAQRRSNVPSASSTNVGRLVGCPTGGDRTDGLPCRVPDHVRRRVRQGAADPWPGRGEVHVVGAGDEQQHRIVVEEMDQRLHDGAHVDPVRRGDGARGRHRRVVGDQNAVVATGDEDVRDVRGGGVRSPGHDGRIGRKPLSCAQVGRARVSR